MTNDERMIERLENRAAEWDTCQMSRYNSNCIWWWLQGAKWVAEDRFWDVLVDLQGVVEAIEEGYREDK